MLRLILEIQRREPICTRDPGRPGPFPCDRPAGITRSKAWLGIALGLLPIIIMEAAMHGSLDSSIRECFERTCAEIGLAPDSTFADFGCIEWSGVSRFLFWAAGLADAALFAMGAIVIVLGTRHKAQVSTEPPALFPS